MCYSIKCRLKALDFEGIVWEFSSLSTTNWGCGLTLVWGSKAEFPGNALGQCGGYCTLRDPGTAGQCRNKPQCKKKGPL